MDIVSKWLMVNKANLMKTLKTSYKIGDDYVVSKIYKDGISKQGKGGHNKNEVMLTTDAFKRLCMRSKTVKAEDVRTYFIELDNFVTMYKTDILNGLLATYSWSLIFTSSIFCIHPRDYEC